MSNALFVNNIIKITQILKPSSLLGSSRLVHVIDEPENLELVAQNYIRRRNDTVEKKRARLLYQSRKRGMLENGLILSTFADKYLKSLDNSQLDDYDKLINLPSNDWDIFNWAVGMKPTPIEFETSVMQLLREHVKNVNKESRLEQPPLR